MQNLLNLGKALNKAEQKSINGGGGQSDCEMNGGTWVCFAVNNGGGCNCLYDYPLNLPEDE